MVHPYDASAPSPVDTINVIYDGNGKTFPSGTTINRVTYTSTPMYIANAPQIAKSPNIADDGTKEGGIPANTDDYDIVVAPGASRLKVEIHYDITTDGRTWIGFTNAATDTYDGFEWQEIEKWTSGTETIVIEGDAITFNTYTEYASSNYGFYARVYPIYATEQTDTSPSADYAIITLRFFKRKRNNRFLRE